MSMYAGDLKGIFREQKISRRPYQEYAQLSFSQEWLWSLYQDEPENPLYNISQAIRISGPLNVQALYRAVEAVVARHESLRTTFSTVDGSPMQFIAEDGSVVMSKKDLIEQPEAKREIEARRLVAEEFRRPFDLIHGPLLRTTLLRVREDEHLLLLNMHQIISDRWSMEILIREIAAFYDAYCNGKSPSLPELPIQYADFAHWQRQWLQGEILAAQLSYWKQQLGDSIPPLQLPICHSRPGIQTFRGKKQSLLLPKTLSEALKALSKREGVTLFMLLLAAFQTLLYRYSGQDDIIVGSPIPNRRQPEIEELIGFLANTLVLRTDLSGDPTFQKLLGRVQEVTLGAYAHQDLPFEKLLEGLQLQKDPSNNSPLQVMFTLQNVPVQALEISDLILQPLDLETTETKCDLTLVLFELPEGLKGSFEYNTDLFPTATIERMVKHFGTLLEGIVSNSDQRLSNLPILTQGERHQMLVQWNCNQADHPKESCVHHMVEGQVVKTPDTIALVFEGEELTYSELDRRANQLAHYLQRLGVGPEVLVAICVHRSVEMLIGLLGILKAGGAYVPLDPAYPKKRLAFMLEDAQVRVLVTQSRVMESFPEYQAEIICLDRDWETIAQESEEIPASPVTAENLAYVIYTSGSTGKPKGVQIPHRALVNFLAAMRHQPGLTDQDVLLAVTTLSFDIAALEFFLPLTVGAKVVIVDREVASDGLRLSARLINCGATVMQATPATWQLLLEAGWQGSPQLKALCGGETLTRELAERLLERCSSLWNMYGPTETTVWSTLYQVKSKREKILIGRPISNTQIYLLDSNLHPVPIGVAGELHIGGEGIARGYLNRPELTEEKFIQNPFIPGERLYRTGDLGRYLPDGNIELLGRIDHQVKIRGFRIELGEIESVLVGHPSVQQAVVLSREDEPGNKRLVSYLVCEPGHTPTTSQLRSFLSDKIPDYMIPSAFVVLPALPLTPNGKVDRIALPTPEKKRPDLGQPYIAPRTQLERYLSDLWCNILRLDRVGIHDRFFELGGTSIEAARFINRLQRELDEFIYIVSVFEAPSITEYATFLKKEYAQSLVKKFPHEVILGAGPKHSAEHKHIPEVDNSTIEQMRLFIPSPLQYKQNQKREDSKNPPVMFILAPPRSGTTLLRVMLAGHPDLFATSELQLLGFNTLLERKTAFEDKYSLWLEGTIRSIMEIKRCDVDQAKRIMEEYEDKAYTTKEFYRLLQEWIGDRILVDKSPSYAFDLRTLKKAERDFNNALFIHLARHPYATIRSFESYRMAQVLYLYDHPFSARELGELLWTISHQNILEFLKGVPKHRQHRIRFEDLVTCPQHVMKEMCQSLGLKFHSELVQPYKHIERKMTDGIYPESAPMGDRKFNEHQRIDPKVADSWKEVLTNNFLGDVTWEVAVKLGYEQPAIQRESDNRSDGILRATILNGRRKFTERQRQLRFVHRQSVKKEGKKPDER